MQNALVIALQARGVDVLTALEAGMIERSDEVKDRVGLPGKASLFSSKDEHERVSR